MIANLYRKTFTESNYELLRIYEIETECIHSACELLNDYCYSNFFRIEKIDKDISSKYQFYVYFENGTKWMFLVAFQQSSRKPRSLEQDLTHHSQDVRQNAQIITSFLVDSNRVGKNHNEAVL